jgi:hypothetical protein
MKGEHQNHSEVIFYQTDDGKSRLQVRFSGETAWLSLGQLAELFQRDNSVISKHIKNIFEERELGSEATVAKFATVQTEGVRTVTREIECYNLDVIISVGYRVKSQRGTQFRIWATARFSPTPGRHRMRTRFARRSSSMKSTGGDSLRRRRRWRRILRTQ